ncbi:MAG TPA: ABC transporter permease [Thermoanaerobaculia bacterium]|nr:ABC transporter permease [Thermoanaerobaculia bacterium]
MLRSAVVRLGMWRHRRRLEDGLDEEVRFHLEEHAAKLERQGMPPAAARRAARLAFGAIDGAKEAVRDEVRLPIVEDFVRDLRFAVRTLVAAPAFSVTAILSLALGIGANTALFSVVHAVLLRPLPYPEPDRLLAVQILDEGDERGGGLSVADLEALSEVRSFATFGASFSLPGGVALTGDGGAEQVVASVVTPGMLAALGVEPARGRWPAAAEGRGEGPELVVVSDGFWRRRLGASPRALGRSLTLDGEPHEVIAVMPPGFHLPGKPRDELWPVLRLEPAEVRAPFWLTTVARLAPRVSAARAGEELTALASAVKRRWPDSPPHWSYLALDLRERLVSDGRPALLVLFAAVCLVLVLAGVNVTNLLLARATARGAELGMRVALGAGRDRLLRQALTESLLIAVVGGGLGLLLAQGGVAALAALRPAGLPRIDEIAVDRGVLVFAAAVTLGTGLLCGLAPALHGAFHQTSAVPRGERGGEARRAGRLRAALVVLEVAVALTVLIGAGLVLRSLQRLQAVPSGAGADDVLVVSLSIPEARYQEEAQVGAFFAALEERVGALAGVEAAAVTMAVPPDRLVMTNPFTPQGAVPRPDEPPPVAEELLIGPGYFDALGVPLLAGRAFTAADDAGAPLVAIVDEHLAERHFGGRDAVGRWLQTGAPHPDSPRLTIVGVAADVRYQGLDGPREGTIYVPFRQSAWWRTMYLVARTSGEPQALVPGVRGAVRALDPEVPLQEITTLDGLVEESTGSARFRALLLGAFAGLSLLLAAAGVYGLIAYEVQRRRREHGVRLALGAQRRHLLARVVADGLRLSAVGVAIGLAGSLLLTRLLDRMLFGVSPLDPVTFASTALFLPLVGLLAALLPARRAAATDPLIVLRDG